MLNNMKMLTIYMKATFDEKGRSVQTLIRILRLLALLYCIYEYLNIKIEN